MTDQLAEAGKAMKLELKVYNSLCSLEKFVINGKDADYEDFGEKHDIDCDSAEDYSCGNMQFFPKPPTSEILKKYKITEKEYETICEKLDCLSFGRCGWCA